MPHFSLELGPLGEGPIHVDGIDVTAQVRGVELISAPGEPTTLILRHVGPGRIEGEGVVQVVPDDVDEQAIVIAWLEQLDPELIEAEVLNSHAWLEPPATMGAAWIQVLARLAAR